MFAVKGWSLDATSLKPQTEVFKSGKAPAQDGKPKQGRKRKRGEAPAAQNQDVGKLWDQHIEGKTPVRSKPKRDRKKQKVAKAQDGESEHAAVPEGAEATARPAENGDAAAKSVRKDKKKGKEKHDQGQHSAKAATNGLPAKKVAASAPPPAPPLPATAKLTPMQAAMRQKLVAARFRHLNQTLYTAPSDTALELFDQNPEMFEDYHAGFRQQVSKWPENPVDSLIATIRARGKVKPPSYRDKRPKSEPSVETGNNTAVLPRTHGTAILADLGCGDAGLAQALTDSADVSKLNLQIHSFDLHSPSPLVTKADISSVPLADGSVDVAIFCLALMGTNWISFIEEAYRILHWKGELWVAEIKSRFGRVGRGAGKPVEHSVGNKKKQAAFKKAQDSKMKEDEEVDENTVLRTVVDGVETKQEATDVSAFVDVLRRRGFLLKDGEKSVDLSNKMFVKMEFIKAAPPSKGKGVPEASSKAGSKAGPMKKKFVEEKDEDIATDDEAKVLKPCLYKIR
ncbi:hypothetical protein LTR36_004584 [Oleoguttula mirabilis]|uniref:Ribosomal RNA-processing protein 8 n=1 Tax=Oleoguttula mirabilis TaxID=1507867 RepID=A0AAV9JHW8_9PEZI|nr:hypothetical protein LTR36_004584 [Oleoguttula mirabilis]